METIDIKEALKQNIGVVEELILKGAKFESSHEHEGVDLDLYMENLGFKSVRNPINGPESANVGLIMVLRLSDNGYFHQTWFDASGKIFSRVVYKGSQDSKQWIQIEQIIF